MDSFLHRYENGRIRQTRMGSNNCSVEITSMKDTDFGTWECQYALLLPGFRIKDGTFRVRIQEGSSERKHRRKRWAGVVLQVTNIAVDVTSLGLSIADYATEGAIWYPSIWAAKENVSTIFVSCSSCRIDQICNQAERSSFCKIILCLIDY